MIRQPSTMKQIYAWHRAAVSGDAPPIHDGMPEAGWFKTRLTKGGPWVAVEIKVEREVDPMTGELLAPETMIAICDGFRRDPTRLWTYLKPITREEHAALATRREAIPEMAATMARLDPRNLATMRPSR